MLCSCVCMYMYSLAYFNLYYKFYLFELVFVSCRNYELTAMKISEIVPDLEKLGNPTSCRKVRVTSDYSPIIILKFRFFSN